MYAIHLIKVDIAQSYIYHGGIFSEKGSSNFDQKKLKRKDWFFKEKFWESKFDNIKTFIKILQANAVIKREDSHFGTAFKKIVCPPTPSQRNS